MAKRYDVRITLVSQLTKCPNGHKVGDQFVVRRKTPEGICLGAFGTLLPYITTLRFGGAFPWEKAEGEGDFCCPDPKVCNVFHLERVPAKGEWRVGRSRVAMTRRSKNLTQPQHLPRFNPSRGRRRNATALALARGPQEPVFGNGSLSR